jgi:hypothetical protein
MSDEPAIHPPATLPIPTPTIALAGSRSQSMLKIGPSAATTRPQPDDPNQTALDTVTVYRHM